MKKWIKSALVVAALAALSYGGYIGYLSLQDYFCWNCTPEGIYNRGVRFLQTPEEKSVDHGLSLIDSAARQNFADAQIFLAEVYLQTFPEGYMVQHSEDVERLKSRISMNQDQAVFYYTDLINNPAVSQGRYKDMQYNLAQLLKSGIVKRARFNARHWLTLSAQYGNVKAMLELAQTCHAEGDYATARQWFSSAFNAGRQPEAAIMIGDYYLYGKGVGKDASQAIQWYEQAWNILSRAEDAAIDPDKKLMAESAAFRLDIARRKRLDLYKEQQAEKIDYRIRGDLGTLAVYAIHKDGDLHIGDVEKKYDRFWAMPRPWPGQAPPSEPIKAASLNDGVNLILENYAVNAFGGNKQYQFILKP